jgi:DeoR/GlpR family transcriptional regulator of sugar metabolism
MTLAELKAHNPKAHSSLVEMWTELSRCSTSTARRDLKENMDDRYTIEEKGGKLLFNDTEAGDTYKFTGEEWE